MSSNLCSCPMASTTVAGTLTGGIQDIAALLPLLGTEQCEDHVGSALTKGYFYAAATPMSLFGSLGLARAGLKTFFASLSVPMWNIAGARTLSNMGFEPQGMNLSLIMTDPNDKPERFLVETRLEKLAEDLHIDKTKIRDVKHKTIKWNLMMTFLCAVLSSFGIFPYIFLTVKIGSTLPHQIQWTFPALRVVGGFLTTIMMQFIIQRRVTTLARRWISEHCSKATAVKEHGKSTSNKTVDVEKNPRAIVTDSNSPLTWLLLVLLLLGVLASIVGYVGCFSVVQSADRSTGPLSWLCLEGGLSLLRMFLWGCNPTFDDAPPLQLVLARDSYPPLPTCKIYDDDITTEKILPLTRANQFFSSITSFTSIVERFDHPDVTLYYTLTRRATLHPDPQNNALHEAGEHVLYITIFDHKERVNTRVYTRRNGVDHFYSTQSSLPVIDPRQGLLDIKLGDEIDNPDDPITSDRDLLSKLIIHYQSIMDQMHFVMGQSTRHPTHRIKNKWTMAMADTETTQHSGQGEITTSMAARTSSLRDFQYLQHGRLEKMCQLFCSARGEWIATYMHWGIQETGKGFVSQANTGMAGAVDDAHESNAKAEGKRRMLAEDTEPRESPLQARSDQEDIESRVVNEIRCMELLLVEEMEIWEEHLRDQANKFIGRPDVLEKVRLTKAWKSASRMRLDAVIRAMEARLDVAKLEVKASPSDKLMAKWQSTHDDIRNAWQALAQRYVEMPTSSPKFRNPSHLSHLQTEYQKNAQNVEAIIGWSRPTAAQREQLRQQSDAMNRLAIELEEAVGWLDDNQGCKA